MKAIVVAALLSVVLAGCASGGRCAGEFEYQKAQSITAIQGGDGVKAPQSGSALRIPPQPKQPVAFAEPVTDADKPGKQKLMCLDTPPVMPTPAVETKTEPKAGADAKS